MGGRGLEHPGRTRGREKHSSALPAWSRHFDNQRQRGAITPIATNEQSQGWREALTTPLSLKRPSGGYKGKVKVVMSAQVT